MSMFCLSKFHFSQTPLLSQSLSSLSLWLSFHDTMKTDDHRLDLHVSGVWQEIMAVGDAPISQPRSSDHASMADLHTSRRHFISIRRPAKFSSEVHARPQIDEIEAIRFDFPL